MTIKKELDQDLNALHYALVLGEPLTEIPEDLYIPKDALEVFLESFSGPLDILLYLIKKQNINILDIPVAKITNQYLAYIDLKEKFQLELAAEYLLMAAMLAEIKSRMLLPKTEVKTEEEDPRAELVRKLQEYERYKTIALDLDNIPRLDRDLFLVTSCPPPLTIQKPMPKVNLGDLIQVFKETLAKAKLFEHHHIQMEALTVRERMGQILNIIKSETFISFGKLFKPEEGRIGIVITFIAILELLKQSSVEIIQTEFFATIHVKAIKGL